MQAVKEEIEHNIWWQVKAGNSSFWFDNWTRQGALYYVEGEGAIDEELEVRDFMRGGEWDVQKLRDKLSEEMTLHIMENIVPPSVLHSNDIPWWMGNTQGGFTMKSAWELLRQRREKKEENSRIWAKGVPFKVNFFLWKVWRRKIATDDNLKRMKINIVSRCWCCEEKTEESMAHLFLTAPIATKLWRQSASFAGINIEDMNLKQLINTWWNMHTTPKLESVYRAMPIIIMWTLWKRRNSIKHGGKVALNDMIWQVQDMVKKLIKSLYPWIKIGKEDWPHMVTLLKEYKPRLHYYSVTWKFPDRDRVKCSIDGAYKGNPGKSAIAICVRDELGYLIYATARGIGIATNIEAETMAIREALGFCQSLNLMGVTIETDSLTLKRMIARQWKVPWEVIEIIEDIRAQMQTIQGNIKHIFREGNTVAVALANEVVDTQGTKE